MLCEHFVCNKKLSCLQISSLLQPVWMGLNKFSDLNERIRTSDGTASRCVWFLGNSLLVARGPSVTPASPERHYVVMVVPWQPETVRCRHYHHPTTGKKSFGVCIFSRAPKSASDLAELHIKLIFGFTFEFPFPVPQGPWTEPVFWLWHFVFPLFPSRDFSDSLLLPWTDAA